MIYLKELSGLLYQEDITIRIHAVRHMIEEGFNETNVVEALKGKSKIIEDYSDDCRCLILGNFHFPKGATSTLHIVCE